MKKLRIISHRGAAGLALENTAASLKRGAALKVSAVELDVRRTKDGQLVLCHDADLLRIAGDKRHVNQLTLKELQNIPLRDGSRLLTLRQALRILQDVPVIVDIKANRCAELVWAEIKKHKGSTVSVASARLDELRHMRSLAPNITLYGLEHTRSLENVHLARMHKLNGIGMNYWLLNPLNYWYARRKGLSIYVFTVNRKFLVRFLSWLYPDIAICTDHAEWFVAKRRTKKGAAHARPTTSYRH